MQWQSKVPFKVTVTINVVNIVFIPGLIEGVVWIFIDYIFEGC